MTPVADQLFQVWEDGEAKLLLKEQALSFHHTVAQLLVMLVCTRRDIQLPVAFLTTRVKAPDEDDWGKLKRCLNYLKDTLHMKLTLEVDNLGTIHWLVDASDNTLMNPSRSSEARALPLALNGNLPDLYLIPASESSCSVFPTDATSGQVYTTPGIVL